MTHAESPPTSIRTCTLVDLGPFVSDCWRDTIVPPAFISLTVASSTIIFFTVGEILSTLPVDHKSSDQTRRRFPLVGYLIKSRHLSSAFDDHSPAVATLKGVVLQNLTVGIFTWESSRELDIFPGEAIIFDFSAFIGHQGSAYRAPLPNLRRIRT
ncbi:hypothetical protein ARMGADRAFT_1087913 [Armillaria gallica]|uniref:Uncharacterized protein n=1 Tax=Armillaria gallica TaxID=47427 RepID=A0A2H3CPP6_ARMGA|nr:hypothetical protein ARMGADRAFT_1087913 [Armillaria gallica]